jgi:DNA-binding response OmpR family regulator
MNRITPVLPTKGSNLLYIGALQINTIYGKRIEGPSYVPTLEKKGFNLQVAATSNEALAYIQNTKPDIVIINASSMRSNGQHIYKTIYKQVKDVPIVLITSVERGNSNLEYAHDVLTLPFTFRKLMNHITPLLAELLPVEVGNILYVGPLRLNLKYKRVQCLGRKAQLTPRQVQILQLLMQQPGVVIERENLFRQVWKTDYTGDTRTLDVHISWLRKAIEEDPRKPQFLKTIRGVGYRLDV